MTFHTKVHILSKNQPNSKMTKKFNREGFNRFRSFIKEITDPKNTQNRFHTLKMYLKETKSYQLSRILEKIWQRAERNRNPLLKQAYVRILGVTGGLREDTPELIQEELHEIAVNLGINLEPDKRRQYNVDEIIQKVLPNGPTLDYTAEVRQEIAKEEQAVA